MRQCRGLKGQINLHAAGAAFIEPHRFVAIHDCLFAAGAWCSHWQQTFNRILEKRSARIQASSEEGGPRSTWVRSRAARAGWCRSTREIIADWRAGQGVGAMEATNTGATVAGSAEGNWGQRDGALKPGPETPLSAASIAQWWAPCRRQQNGRRTSSLPGASAISAGSQKSKISEMERARRMTGYTIMPSRLETRQGQKCWSGMIEL